MDDIGLDQVIADRQLKADLKLLRIEGVNLEISGADDRFLFKGKISSREAIQSYLLLRGISFMVLLPLVVPHF